MVATGEARGHHVTLRRYRPGVAGRQVRPAIGDRQDYSARSSAVPPRGFVGRSWRKCWTTPPTGRSPGRLSKLRELFGSQRERDGRDPDLVPRVIGQTHLIAKANAADSRGCVPAMHPGVR
jgi:hypothetical protein